MCVFVCVFMCVCLCCMCVWLCLVCVCVFVYTLCWGYLTCALKLVVFLAKMRTYIKKQKMYTETSIACAVSQIKMGKSLKKTAAKYHMLRFMLRRRVKEEAGLFTREKQGRQPALSTIVEEKLTECIIQMARLGFGPTRTESIDIIHEYIVANRIRTRFKSDRPGSQCAQNRKYWNKLNILAENYGLIVVEGSNDAFW